MNDIERIKSKLSDQHIELCAPVDISDIRNFEKTYHVSLPQELVDFYTLISNGCQMIDEFQLFPFEKWYFDPESAFVRQLGEVGCILSKQKQIRLKRS